MELGAAGYAAAGAAAAGGVGVGLFGYNRGNYMMDQKHSPPVGPCSLPMFACLP